MKTAAKVFLIISIVLSGILALTYLILTFINLAYLAAMIVAIIPIIVDSIALKKMSEATCKKDIIPIAIVALIFGGFLGGLFLLLTDDSDYGTSNYSYNTNSFNKSSNYNSYGSNSSTFNSDSKPQQESKNNIDDLETKLKKLTKLHDEGVLTDEEYESARKKVVEELTK